jgi:glutaredoxin
MVAKKECPSCEFTSEMLIDCPYCELGLEECAPVTPPTKALSIRKNNGKLRMDLVPVEAELAIAEVLTKGLEKYEEDQWRKGNYYSVPYASLKRHLAAWWGGEDKDPETLLNHLKHVIMNATMLLYYTENYPELDNRPKKKGL